MAFGKLSVRPVAFELKSVRAFREPIFVAVRGQRRAQRPPDSVPLIAAAV